MISRKWLQWMFLAIPNFYLFFLCSTKWNAGCSISAGLLGVLILVIYGWKRQKIRWNSLLFLLFYAIFMGSVIFASWMTGDRASFQLSIRFLSYSLPFWLFYLVLQRSPSLFHSTFWGTLSGSWVLLALTYRDLMHPLMDHRVHASFASANNFAMCLEAILPLLWMETLWSRKEYKQSAWGKMLFAMALLTSVLLTGALFLSRSRGGIAGFLLGALAVIIGSLLQGQRNWTLQRKIGVLVAALCIATVGGFRGTIMFGHRSYDGERLLLIQSACRMWEDHKIYGVGFQQWNRIYRTKYILPGAKEPNLSLAHNNVANFFSGTGTLGGLGYLLFTFGSLAVLLRKIYQEPGNIYGKMMLWVWLAIFIHGMVDNSLYAKFNTRLYFAMWGISMAALLPKKDIGKCKR